MHGLLLHSPSQLLGPQGEALAAALRAVRTDGLVGRIGVSVYAPDELAAIYPIHSIDLVQAPLNLVDRRLVESGWLQRLADDGVEVHSRSCFLQGLLLMQQVPARFASWKHLWACWKSWLAAHPGQAVAACLAYPLAQSQVARVVVGVDSLNQMTELLAASQKLPTIGDLPNLSCADDRLINPSKWMLSEDVSS